MVEDNTPNRQEDATQQDQENEDDVNFVLFNIDEGFMAGNMSFDS